jgi:hypothetical protein
VDQGRVDERGRELIADPLDVHRAARAEMPHALDELRGA